MHGKTLLLISNSQVLMDFAKKRLERAGYSVCCVSGLDEAKKQCGDKIPDGILVESELPDGKGVDFCREVRKGCDVPIMFLSHDKNDELEALRSGADDFLKKPFDYEILKARLGVLLNMKPRADLSPDDFDDGPNPDEAEPDGPEPGPVAQKNTPYRNIRRLYALVAACFLMMTVAIGVFFMRKTPEEFSIEDESVPLAEFPLWADSPYNCSVTEMGVKIPEFGDITVEADSADVDILLFNPEDNSCFLGYEILLPDTGETLYLSEMMAPGEYEKSLTLSRGLAKGEYAAVIKAVAYASKDLAVVEELEIPLRLTAR